MSFWRQITRGLRVLTNRKAADQDVSDEVQHYFEEAVAAFEAKGLSPDEARRAAQLELGNTTIAREQVRSYGWENLMSTLFADLRYAGRQLRRNPGFALVAVITLALGIGASTAIFSVVDPILFEPLPYPQASRIMMIWDTYENSRSDVTFHTFRELSERNRSFEAVAVMRTWQPAMSGVAEPERFDAQKVTVNYFRVLGVLPAQGRGFQASDDTYNGPKVVIVSDALWRRRFGSDAGIIGRQIRLDDENYTIVGVMPRTFENVLAPSAELWTPLQYDPADATNFNTREWGHHLHMVGRLLPSVTMEHARRDLDLIAKTPVPEFIRPQWAALQNGFIVDSLQREVTRGVRPALLAVFGAVMLVLFIACVNVTNLLLARGAQRLGEFAMRAALGAARSRLLRQLLTESLLLAVIGGTLGTFVARIGIRALVALSPPGLPRVGSIGINAAALTFAFTVTTIIGLLVGLVPALQASRRDPHTELQQTSRSAAGSHQLTRRALVVVEVALALVLLVGAGLLLRSLERIFAVDPGFSASHVLTMEVQTSGHRFDDHFIRPEDRSRVQDHALRRRFFEQALEAVRSLPGVSSAAFTSLLPLNGDLYGAYGAHFDQSNRSWAVFRYVATPEYLKTMGIPLHSGRLLDSRDVFGAPPVILISESLARAEFAGQDPIGQRVQIGPPWAPHYEIVGVVGDVRQNSLALSEAAAVYMTPAQSWFADQVMTLVVRTPGDAASPARAIKNAIWSVDKDQPIVRIGTMEELVAASSAQRRFVLILFEAFGLAALVLAAIGIYGVLSGSVTERTREIGVRAALGASRTDILGLILRQGMSLTAIGVVIGLAGAVAASQALISMLFGISRLDVVTYVGVIALLAAVSAMACWMPAWRAARVDPCITLRAE